MKTQKVDRQPDAVKAVPSVTLIITCYNKPELLKLALETSLDQTVLPREIVVADDGSGSANRDVVREIRQSSPIPILHVWQPDDGFRLNKSRNNGLAVASGDYVVLLDGDSFVDRRFIEDHLAVARKGRYVTGSRAHIGEKLKERILRTGDTRVSVFTPGISKRLHLIRSKILSKLASHEEPPETPIEVRKALGSNMAFWREDAFRVNGFNEAWSEYGEDDLEFIDRLAKIGVVGLRLRHLAVARHFRHGGRRSDDREATLDRVRRAVEEDGIRVRPELGLTRALADQTIVVEGRE